MPRARKHGISTATTSRDGMPLGRIATSHAVSPNGSQKLLGNGKSSKSRSLMPELSPGAAYGVNENANLLASHKIDSALTNTWKAVTENGIGFSSDLPNIDHRKLNFFRIGDSVKVMFEVMSIEDIKNCKKTWGFIRLKGCLPRLMSMSGWTPPCRTYNEALLDSELWTNRVKKLCRDTGFKLPNHGYDGTVFGERVNGRFRACHVEMKLMLSFVYDLIHDDDIRELKRKLQVVRDCDPPLHAEVIIDLAPCRWCIEFGEHLTQMTGIIFTIHTNINVLRPLEVVQKKQLYLKNNPKRMLSMHRQEEIVTKSQGKKVPSSHKQPRGSKRKNIVDETYVPNGEHRMKQNKTRESSEREKMSHPTTRSKHSFRSKPTPALSEPEYAPNASIFAASTNHVRDQSSDKTRRRLLPALSPRTPERVDKLPAPQPRANAITELQRSLKRNSIHKPLSPMTPPRKTMSMTPATTPWLTFVEQEYSNSFQNWRSFKGLEAPPTPPVTPPSRSATKTPESQRLGLEKYWYTPPHSKSPNRVRPGVNVRPIPLKF